MSDYSTARSSSMSDLVYLKVDWLHWEMCINKTCQCRTGPVQVVDSDGSLKFFRPGPEGIPTQKAVP